MNITTLQQLFHQHMVSGIWKANIFEDGGLQCYQEIPYFYHTAFIVVLSAIHIVLILKYRHQLSYYTQEKDSNIWQKRFAIFCLVSYIITFLFKIQTKKGIFMLNPCHITIVFQIYFHFKKNTYNNRIMFNCWTAWLFGPYMATIIPHLNGIDDFQVILYFYEHLVIIPLGYLILSRRYGFIKPTLKNHLPAFGTIALYQFLVLAPVSRLNMVNLNFALCHSPADPSFDVFGYYYFVVCTAGLNIFSYLARWISYLQVRLLYFVLSIFKIKSPQIQTYKLQDIQTPQGQTKEQNRLKKVKRS